MALVNALPRSNQVLVMHVLIFQQPVTCLGLWPRMMIAPFRWSAKSTPGPAVTSACRVVQETRNVSDQSAPTAAFEVGSNLLLPLVIRYKIDPWNTFDDTNYDLPSSPVGWTEGKGHLCHTFHVEHASLTKA